MAIAIAGVGAPAAASGAAPVGEAKTFARVLDQALPRAAASHGDASQPAVAQAAVKPGAPQLVREVAAAQARLDGLMKLAESGRTFTPAELLAFQAHAYRASQELDLAGKVVEKATAGVKQTLNTQV
jgi:hypothetical protein